MGEFLNEISVLRSIHYITLFEDLIRARSLKSHLELDVFSLIAQHEFMMNFADVSHLSIDVDGMMSITSLNFDSSNVITHLQGFVTMFCLAAIELKKNSEEAENIFTTLLAKYNDFELLEDPLFFYEWDRKEKNEINDLIVKVDTCRFLL